MLSPIGEPCAVISNFNRTLYEPILASAQPTGQAGAESAGLYTSGGLIYGPDGNTVTLHGLNWFGFDDGNTIVDGLWVGSDSSTLDVATILLRMKALGFNAIRLPFSFKV